MMREVYIVADNIISPLGFTTRENFQKLLENQSAISHHAKSNFAPQPFFASLLNKAQDEKLSNDSSESSHTKFEKLVISSITEALQHTTISASDASTIIIISTTKGNISLLETEEWSNELNDRIALHSSARIVQRYFGNPNMPVVVSNACISGLTAMLTGKRLLESGRYKHAIVTGADVISKFILSGFQSFQAVSDQPCKPFDETRNGVTLGEAAGTVVLSTDPHQNRKGLFSSGAGSNDANHISGPSRTGEELCLAINKSLNQASLTPADIGFVCAHGTATVYNDEMEAKAFSLANLTAPVNSLKGFYGHTLGAAGILETILSVEALERNVVLPTAGYQKKGVTSDINICAEAQPHNAQAFLKTASGFGGCNSAIVIKKS